MGDKLQQDTQQELDTTQQDTQQEPEKLFTQEDVNRIVGERLSRARLEAGDAATYKQERDEAREELEQYKNNAFLESKRVQEQDRDYVAFKARQLMDSNTDFCQAVEKFLKENPRWAANKYNYRVSTGVDHTEGSGAGVRTWGDSEIRKAMGLEG